MSIFDEGNELQPQSINWGKVGDNVFGTKVGQRNGITTMFGLNSIYEIKIEGGMFHDKDGNEVQLKAGDVWGVWGRNDIFDAQLNRMQLGQKLGLKFTETKPSKMGNDAKIIKVYTTGELDQAFLSTIFPTEGEAQAQ